MKENKYDDKIFYEKYSQMNRSKRILRENGNIKGMLPDFKERNAGFRCGYGWHQIYAMENGASSVGVIYPKI